MQVVQLSKRCFEFASGAGDRRARTERGPELKTAIATKELFASRAVPENYAIGDPLRRDKFGKLIVEGEEFAYLDRVADEANWPWHVYELCIEDWVGETAVIDPETGEFLLDDKGQKRFEKQPSWRRRGHYFDEAEARAAALEILNAGAA